MKEDNPHIDYFQLIGKYLSGNASSSEVQLLEEWVLSAPENRAQFNAIQKAWIISGMHENNGQIDVEKDWQDLAGQLFPGHQTISLPEKPGRSLGFWVRIAAAAAVVLLASVWGFQHLGKGDRPIIATQSETTDHRLPDGTEISLNQYSTVRYLSGPADRLRQVELTGDALFNVARDTVRPFVIRTQNVEIEVLGTTFYVDSREEQPHVQVIVQTGSVAVKAGAKTVALDADEIAIYDKLTGELRKKPNDDENFLAWKTDVLVFEKDNLEKVVFDLNRKFYARISIANPELRTCEITATYDHKSLDTIVTIIEKTLNISTERRGEEIVFVGEGCE